MVCVCLLAIKIQNICFFFKFSILTVKAGLSFHFKNDINIKNLFEFKFSVSKWILAFA